MHNDYPLILYKTEIKYKVLPKYHLMIVDLYNFPIGNVKKLIPNFFDEENYVLNYEDLQFYLRLGLKLNKYIVYWNLISYNG